MKNKDYEASL